MGMENWITISGQSVNLDRIVQIDWSGDGVTCYWGGWHPEQGDYMVTEFHGDDAIAFRSTFAARGGTVGAPTD